MVRQHQARGFNAGRWASRQGLFSMKEFEKIAEDALEVRNQLHHRNTDQAFFNYCCDTQPVNYGHFAEVLGDICQQGWANQPGHVYEEDNTYRLWNCGGLDHTEQVILIHWAGISNRRIIPERRWYLKYRYLRSSQITYLLASIIMFVVSLPDVLLRKIRQQRHINQLYHHFFRRDS
jgi:hypothetical protein